MSLMKDDLNEEIRPKLYLGREGDDDEDEEARPKDPEEDDEETVGGEREIAVSYACEDCDYRWEVYLEEEDDEMDDTQYCPMCGSANTSQI
jgi:DNA-directed RNA polymerase subunit RPC12/RpoP